MEERIYQIVPYAVTDGVPTFRDSEIAEWFARIEKEDTLRRLFFDGTVIYAKDLIRLVKTPGVFFFTVWTDGMAGGKRQKAEGEDEPGDSLQVADYPPPEMAGFFWMCDFIGNAAFVHYALFRKFWGFESRRIGRTVLEFIFGTDKEDGKPLVGTLIGLVPVNNVMMLHYMRAVGMKRSGRIPGVFYDVYNNCAVDGVMTCMDRARCVKTRKED